jgi:uncharacterized membrane protein
VLAWLAFGVASYVAFHGQDVSASCIGGGSDCNVVQSSSWSVWLGVPVAIAGLACYASLAGLSVMSGMTDTRFSRWVGTFLVMLSLIAAISGLWFAGIQFFILETVCLACMAVHLCGLLLAGAVIYGVLVDRPGVAAVRSASTSFVALRAAIPSAGGGSASTVRSIPALQRTNGRPSLGLAAGGAALVLGLLIGGQLLFPADGTYRGTVTLAEPVQLDGASSDADAEKPKVEAAEKHLYVANKIATEAPGNDPGVKTTANVEPSKEKKDSVDLFPISDSARGDGSAREASEKDGVATALVEVPVAKKRMVSFLDSNVTLDMYRFPVLGDPEAPHVVLEFVSYDCTHCRQTHRMVRRALERYGNQVAVVVLMIPQGMECNKEIKNPAHSKAGSCTVARMALGVSKLDPTRFAKFHDWLMEGKDNPPPEAQVVLKAYNSVGRERMKSLSNEEFLKQVSQNIDLFNRIKAEHPEPKKIGLPLMIMGKQIHAGTPKNETALFNDWEEFLGVKPGGRVDGSTAP